MTTVPIMGPFVFFFCLFLFRYMIQYLHSTGSGAAGNLKSKFENLAREQEEVCLRLPY